MKDFWHHIYWLNSVEDWFYALFVMLDGFLIAYIIQKWLLIKLSRLSVKTTNSIDDFIIVGLRHSVFPLLYVGIAYIALHSNLHFSDYYLGMLQKGTKVVVLLFILRAVTESVKYFILAAMNHGVEKEARKKQVSGLIFILNVGIWIIGIIFILDNLKYNVTTLIAGFGIGGIAIALAAQTILVDLFSYFVIFFDRPFEIGDHIALDDKSGIVENIGVKTTRIRTASGEELVCSNKDLTNSRVHNYHRMNKRRVTLKLKIVYQTTADQLKKVTPIVKKIIGSQSDVEYDQGYFTGFGDSSLNFEFEYHILGSSNAIYMDRQQAILFAVFEALEKEKIHFAYPTQMVYWQSSDKGVNKEI